jgi:hypothetical protein
LYGTQWNSQIIHDIGIKGDSNTACNVCNGKHGKCDGANNGDSCEYDAPMVPLAQKKRIFSVRIRHFLRKNISLD